MVQAGTRGRDITNGYIYVRYYILLHAMVAYLMTMYTSRSWLQILIGQNQSLIARAYSDGVTISLAVNGVEVRMTVPYRDLDRLADWLVCCYPEIEPKVRNRSKLLSIVEGNDGKKEEKEENIPE